MAGPQAVSLTGDDYIDALLTGYKWDTTNLSYSFPDSGIWYLLESAQTARGFPFRCPNRFQHA